jgi:DNA replication and repair protein RecF
VILKEVSVYQYRNLERAEFNPSSQITLLYGLNGQGKTNLLESIYLLGNARTFRTSKLCDLIKHGQTAAHVKGKIESCGIVSEISLQLEPAARRLSIDGKGIQRSAELHGKLAVVVFSPDDTAMIKLGPDTRRRYLDRTLYSGNQGFLKDYHDFYRTLKQRNQLLKKGLQPELPEWNEQFATTAVRIMAHRKLFCKQLNERIKVHYSNISGDREQVEISYKPDLEPDCPQHDKIMQIIKENQETDLRYGSTGRGPHRDDLSFLINGRPLKSFGSQGQQRSFVLALKMAELDSLQDMFGEPPVLLLDDMASELDQKRISNLMEFLKKREIQVIITTTDKAALDPVFLETSAIYRVENGTLTYEGNITR